MKAAALEPRSPVEGALLLAAVLLSVLAHGTLAAGVAQIERKPTGAPVWVEMTVAPPPAPVEPPPAPEPPPEPPPEAPKELPKEKPKPAEKPPEPIDFKETTPEKAPEPPPDRKPVRRITQGLSADSMAPGSGAGLQARQGNTTAAAASTPQLQPGEDLPYAVVPYASVKSAPRLSGGAPALTIPPVMVELGLEGRVEVELTIGPDGRVAESTVLSGLHPEVDAACLADLRRTRWTPGTVDGAPVAVRGVPYSCRYKAVD